MAKKQRWSRYQPPRATRTEDGRAVDSPADRASSGRSAKTSKAGGVSGRTTTSGRSSTAKTGTPAKAATSRGLAVSVIAAIAFVVVVVIAVVSSVTGSEEPGDNPELETEILNEAFLDGVLDTALEVEGRQVMSIRLTDYSLTLEYFDPNRRQTRRFESYRSDDPSEYSVRVSDSFYDEYEPRPFDLTTITPAMLIAAVEDALAEVSDATYYSLTVESDRDTGQVSMITRVSADDNVTQTAVPDLAEPSPLEPSDPPSTP